MPTSAAIACSNCARVFAMSIRLALADSSCVSRLHDVGARGDAGRVAVLRQRERALVRLDGVLEHALDAVRDAELQVVLRELRLQRKLRVREIGRRRLRAPFARLDAAPDAAPQIDLPGDVRRRREQVRGAAAARVRGVRARAARVRSDAGEELGARDAHGGAGLPVVRFGNAQRLVRRNHLLLQRIELRVAVDLPPLPRGAASAGCAGLLGGSSLYVAGAGASGRT